jgi:hypothetical protein
MNSRKFYKTIFTVEVLSEREPVSDDLSLEEIEKGFIDGNWSGKVTCESEEISAQEAAYELMEHGSEPEFFGLTEDGEDESDEDDEDELMEDEEFKEDSE